MDWDRQERRSKGAGILVVKGVFLITSESIFDGQLDLHMDLEGIYYSIEPPTLTSLVNATTAKESLKVFSSDL